MGYVCVYCDNTCSGSCTGGCSGGCKGSCSGTCTANCSNDCTGTCTNTCAKGCSNDCTNGCTGTCNTTCQGSCTDACNVGCVGNTTTTLYSNLILAARMESSNINDIATFIYNEAARRNASPTLVSTSIGEKITTAKINTMISNLSKAGQTTSYSASAGSKSLKALG